MSASNWSPLRCCVGHITKLHINGVSSDVEASGPSVARSDMPWHSQVGAWHGIPPCCVPLQGLSSSSYQGHEDSSAQGAAEPSCFSSPSDTNCIAGSSCIMLLDLIFLITEFLMKKESKSAIKNYLGTQVNEM